VPRPITLLARPEARDDRDFPGRQQPRSDSGFGFFVELIPLTLYHSESSLLLIFSAEH